tara:strand:+ start:398 stop:1384 length:987 start_codon:yes stop_codon:yes gene_type:complete
MEKLIIVNIAAALAHGLLALFLAIYPALFREVNNPPLLLTRYKNDTTQARDANCSQWPSLQLIESTGVFPVFWLLFIIELVTFAAHVGYASSGAAYLDMVRAGTNAFRWVEYGVTAALIGGVLANLAGIRDVYTLVIIIFAVFSWMQHGYAIESAIRRNEVGFFGVGMPLIVGFALLVAIFVPIADMYTANLDTVDRVIDYCDSDSKSHNFDSFPRNLNDLIWITFAFYGSFGLVALAYVVDAALNGAAAARSRFGAYEVAYIALSFVSKVILVLWALISVFAEDGALAWLFSCPFGSTTCTPCRYTSSLDGSTCRPPCKGDAYCAST